MSPVRPEKPPVQDRSLLPVSYFATTLPVPSLLFDGTSLAASKYAIKVTVSARAGDRTRTAAPETTIVVAKARRTNSRMVASSAAAERSGWLAPNSPASGAPHPLLMVGYSHTFMKYPLTQGDPVRL